MKTALPSNITSIDEAKAFLKALYDNGEIYHPDDDATDIGIFTQAEGEQLNRLMAQVHTFDPDPCAYIIDVLQANDPNH